MGVLNWATAVWSYKKEKYTHVPIEIPTHTLIIALNSSTNIAKSVQRNATEHLLPDI